MVSLRETVRWGFAPDPGALRTPPPDARPPRVVARIKSRSKSKTRPMAIYHASVKSFSRGQGHSGTAAAAYRAGIAIADELTGIRHDYTRRRGVASVDMLAPEDAPEWARDPAACFNASEKAETRANARVGRELEVALPAELDEQQRHALALDLGQMLVERYRVGVLVAVHEPDKSGDERNHHCHLLMTPRQIGPNGLGNRACAEFDARGGAGPAAIRALREKVAERVNAHLARAQIAGRVDHRSLADQATAAEAEGRLGFAAALAREPTSHEGKAATRMRRRGEHSERAEANDQIQSANRTELRAFLALLEKEGRLMETPPRHTQEAAQAECRATNAAPPPRPRAQAPAATRAAKSTARTPGASKQRAGPAQGTRLAWKGMNGRDAEYFRQRQAEAEERMREAEHYAREWLASVEKAGRQGADWVRRLMDACDPERARIHAQAPGFPTMAAELREDMRQAARDGTRRDRREQEARLTQWGLDDAKRKQAWAEKEDPQPSLARPISRREWAKRRRERAEEIERRREERNRARHAARPEAIEKYDKVAETSLARLERTIATMEARYPMEIDQAHALPHGPPAQIVLVSTPDLTLDKRDEQRSRRAASPPRRPRL